MITRIVVIAALAAFLGVPATATADETFKARLSGDQEVPAVIDQGTTGKFEIQFNRDFTEGEFTLRVDAGVQVTQAHLHCAVAGSNGPIIIWLAGIPPQGTMQAPTPNGWNVDGKWVSNTAVTNANILNPACGTTLAAIAQAMSEGRVYANVHSLAKPGGVARGQIETNHH